MSAERDELGENVGTNDPLHVWVPIDLLDGDGLGDGEFVDDRENGVGDKVVASSGFFAFFGEKSLK